MVIKIKREFEKYHFLFFPIIFAILAFISVGYLAHFDRIYYGTDITFHLNRFYDLYSSMAHGKIPLFNTNNSLPRGIAQMVYYPWLTLVPIVFLVSWIKNAVTMSYAVIGIIVFMRYIVSFYSYRTLDRNLSHDLLFSLIYSNSGILFNWEIRSMDWGLAIASIFMPLVMIGFIQLLKHNHYKMMTLGLILVVFSHVLSGAMMAILLVILGLLNIYRFNVKKIMVTILSVIYTIAATSVFWYPALILHEYNHILSPAPFDKYISFGLLYMIGNTSNYIYGLTEIVGLLSILVVFSHHCHYHWFDFQLWMISVFCIILNIPAIWDPIQRAFPALAELQFIYRMSIIAHVCCSILAIKLITGKYENVDRLKNLAIDVAIIIFLCVPLANEVSYHFLMHRRPLETANNVTYINNHIWTKRGKNNMYDQHKYNNGALQMVSKRDVNNLDYSVPKVSRNKYFFNKKLTLIIGKHHEKNVPYKNIPINDDASGIIFKNKHYSNIELPIAVYHHVNYTFVDNERRLPAKLINRRLSSRNGMLVIKHLQTGEHHINIESATIEGYPQTLCWGLLILVFVLMMLGRIYNRRVDFHKIKNYYTIVLNHKPISRS